MGSRLTGTYIPARLDGSGLVQLQISDWAFEQFRMASFPEPVELQSGSGRGLRIQKGDRGYNLGGMRYRIALDERTSGAQPKWKTVCFQLSTNMTNETLFVLAKQLRDVGASFTGICNANGKLFRHIGLTSAFGVSEGAGELFCSSPARGA